MRHSPLGPPTGLLLLSTVLFAGCRESLIEPMNRRPALVAARSDGGFEALDLGTLGGAHSAAYGINAAGQVVGSSETADGLTHAFLWRHGVMTDLGTLGGPSSAAYAINAAGHVVGWSQIASGETHAFLWRDGGMSDLGTLGGPHSYAYAINARDQVVGNAWKSPGGVVTFLWRNGVMTNLGGVKFSVGTGINARGDVVGYSEQFTDYLRATLWRHGTATNLGLLADIPLHFIPQSAAFGINNRRQVVGHSDIQGYTGPQHAFLWQNGAMTDLGTLGGDSSTASAITAQGEIVGNSQQVGGVRHAVLWRNGELIDLGAIGAGALSVASLSAVERPTDRDRDGSSQQLLDLAMLSAPTSDTSVSNAMEKAVRNSKMSHCCRREGPQAEGATALSLAEVPSYATDMNERGEVVGYYYGAGSSVARAILWLPR